MPYVSADDLHTLHTLLKSCMELDSTDEIKKLLRRVIEMVEKYKKEERK